LGVPVLVLTGVAVFVPLGAGVVVGVLPPPLPVGADEQAEMRMSRKLSKIPEKMVKEDRFLMSLTLLSIEIFIQYNEGRGIFTCIVN